jgi:hypothetical protein
VKNTLATLIATMTVLAVGCDPGMSIRQTKSSYEATNGASATGARIVIDVKTTRQIIGETHYAPQVKITNASTSSIAITSVDLISLGTTYANKPLQPGFYPLALQPGKTEDLLVCFDLNDAVNRIFQHPAELLVHCRNDNKEEIVHAVVVDGPLNTATP